MLDAKFDLLLSSKKKFTLASVALGYLILRFGLTNQFDEIGPYTNYIFEVFCVVLSAVIIGRQGVEFLKINKNVNWGIPISLVAGYGVFKLAVWFGILIPFEFKGIEILLTLLLIAPILEEALFRFLIWQPLKVFISKPWAVLVITSIIFSYSHLHSIWFAPEDFYKFIIYQTIYTFLLGLACGYYVQRYASVSSAILIHFSFNLGFYLASL